MLKAKIVKSGNSRAVIIPAALANELGWKVGDEVVLEPMATGLAVTDVAGRKNMVAIARRLLREHDEVYRNLANR